MNSGHDSTSLASARHAPGVRPGALLLLAALLAPAAMACDAGDVPDGEVIRGDVGRRAHEFLLDLADDGFSGAVLLSRRGEILLKHGYGYANRESRVPNTSETLFNIASVSKVFTAAAALRLEEQQALSTESRLSEYIGEFPEPKSAATIHHLLTHTAGLVVRGASLDYDSRDGFVDSVRRAPVEAVPGEEYRYTNAGYTLLAAVVEAVSGVAFESFLEQQLFNPACMNRTAFIWEERIATLPFATGYAGDSVAQLAAVAPETDIWGNRGPSNIATTVGDLYRWVLALQGGRVLTRASTDKMFTAWVGDEGYGWHVIDTDHGRLFRRGGGLPDFESSLRWYADSDVVIVALLNNHIGFRLPVVEGLEDVVFGDTDAPHGVAQSSRLAQ